MSGAYSLYRQFFCIFLGLFSFHLKAKDLSDLNLNLFDGKVSIVGEWAPDERAISRRYHQVTPSLFGAYIVVGPDGKALQDSQGNYISSVRTQHYVVGEANGTKLVGYKVLPLENRPEDSDNYLPSVYYPPAAFSADDQQVVGSEALDEQLSQSYYGSAYEKIVKAGETAASKLKNIRDQFELELKKPVAGILGYFHPQYFKGTVQTVTDSEGYETQGGFGHMGAYVGLGRDLDSPEGLHGGIGVQGEPAVLYSVKLKKAGAEGFENAAYVNRNFIASARILNAGVKFPETHDYGRDLLKAVNLRTVLAIWRAWLDPEWVFDEAVTGLETSAREKKFQYKLKNDPYWVNYCAEFVTLAWNAGLNIQHNVKFYQLLWPKDFRHIYGLYVEKQKKRLSVNYPGLTNEEYEKAYSTPENAFTALWQSDVKLLAERAANPEADLGDLPTAKIWGRNLVWNPLKTVDLLSQFIASFVPWTRHGALIPGDLESLEANLQAGRVNPMTAANLALAMAPQALDRMNIKFPQFTSVAVPIVASMVAFELAWKRPEALENEASYTSAVNMEVAKLQAALFAVFSMNDSLMAGQSQNAWVKVFEEIKNEALANMATEREDAVTSKALYRRARSLKGLIASSNDVPADYKAYQYFLFAIRDNIKEGRSTEITHEGEVESFFVADYSPPKISHSIVQGMHRSNPRVLITAEGTVMHASEVRKNSAGGQQLDPLAGLRR